MEKLDHMAKNAKTLAEGLKHNGQNHNNYKLYTSMERALAILLSGEIFLSDGTSWNDITDKEIMHTKRSYAMCLSASTRENIAMWMLYGKSRGKQAAMLNFYPTIMKELVALTTIDLGEFDERGLFHVKHTLYKDQDEFKVFLSDVIYVDECKKGRVKLTLGDEHYVANENVLDNADIFYKNYSWAYERECRLVVRLNEKWEEIVQKEEIHNIRIKMSKASISKMLNKRLVRSPVYSGGVSVGEPSALTDKINWEL